MHREEEELTPFIMKKAKNVSDSNKVSISSEEDSSNGSVENGNSIGDSSSPIREHGLSAFGTGLNFVKGMLGPGCLSIPLIFRQAGLLMGTFLIIVFGVITTNCMHKLVDCSQHLSKRKRHQYLDYGDVAYEACSQGFAWARAYREPARILVNASIVSLQVGICSVSVVFIAAHLREICVELFGWDGISQQQWILLVTGPLVLINFVRSLHNIVFLSVIGSILMLSSLTIVFQYLIRMEHKPMEELKLFTDVQGMFSASGAVLYAFEGQAMVLPLENKLRRPSQMDTILSGAMSFVSIVYIVCGVAGYATYGDRVEGSIALNLPRETLFMGVRLMFSLVVFFGFVMQQYVVVEMLWPRLRHLLIGGSASSVIKSGEKHNSSNIKTFIWEMCFRAGLVMLSALLALAVPRLERIIPLVGMSAGMLLAVVFPALLDVATFLPAAQKGATNFFFFCSPKWAFRLALNALFVLIGLVALFGGVEENLVDLLITRNK